VETRLGVESTAVDDVEDQPIRVTQLGQRVLNVQAILPLQQIDSHASWHRGCPCCENKKTLFINTVPGIHCLPGELQISKSAICNELPRNLLDA